MENIKCTFIIEWDNGQVVITDCLYNPKTGYTEPEISNGSVPEGSLMREYITLENGDELEVCQDCHEYVMKTTMGNKSDLSYGEVEECHNPNCPY